MADRKVPERAVQDVQLVSDTEQVSQGEVQLTQLELSELATNGEGQLA